MLTTRPLRVAIVCSSRVPGLGELLSDPTRGSVYEIACVLSAGSELSELDAIVDAGIPCIARSAPPNDLGQRRAYDAATAAALQAFDVELIVLCCYLRILTAPMLEAFPGRILNLHDSDLSILTADGKPRYTGLRSTRDALVAGETETRATAHWVDERVDGGPILRQTEPYPVAPLVADARRWGAIDILRAQAFAHREWVIRSAWGPLMRDSIHLVARDLLLEASA